MTTPPPPAGATSAGYGPIGKQRPNGKQFLLALVTFGLYGIYWVYVNHEEIERDGRLSPVGPATAFWILLFGVSWYVKCQNALNQYWASKGASAPSGWTS